MVGSWEIRHRAEVDDDPNWAERAELEALETPFVQWNPIREDRRRAAEAGFDDVRKFVRLFGSADEWERCPVCAIGRPDDEFLVRQGDRRCKRCWLEADEQRESAWWLRQPWFA